MVQRTIKWKYPDTFEGTDDSFTDKRIKSALQTMSAYYDELIFKGYMDGPHFCITNIINGETSLTRDEILEMYYIAFAPETININNVQD